MLALAALLVAPVAAQEAPRRVVPAKAFAASLLLPGLGHRYVQDRSWRGRATFFVGLDVGLWAGLFGAGWRQDQRVQSYQTLAASRAGVIVDGKDRAFYLNLATYLSSETYLDAQLRNRSWDRIEYVNTPEFQWRWASVEDFEQFRELRDDAETFGRRRSVYAALLVANRLLSGISAVVQAGKANARPISIALAPPPIEGSVPTVHLSIGLQ